MGRHVRAAAVLLVVGLVVTPGLASAKKRALALFPMLERDAPDAAVVQRMTSRLVELGRRVTSIEVLSSRQLKSRLRSSPAKAIVACGSDLTCIARLGRRVNADEVLLARATGKPVGVEFVFVVVDARSQKIVRKVRTATITSRLEIEGVLADAGDEVFGVSVDALVAAAAPPTVTVPTEQSERAAAAVAAESLGVESDSEAWAPERSTLTYPTVGSAGLAIRLAAGGVGFGVASGSAWNDVTNDTTLSQLEAQRLTDRSNSQATTANVMFGLALAAAVLATSLFGWDWYLHGPMWSDPEP